MGKGRGAGGPQPPSMAGGYAIAGQMGPQAMQYYAVQQSAAAQGMPLQQHQGGVIFLCDPRTEKECLQRGLFGLPATQTQIVRAIVPEATLLFLFNVRAPSPLCACTRLAQFYF